MKKLSMLILVCMAMVVFLGTEVFAQKREKGNHKRFQMTRLCLLTDALDLTEEQAAKVFPIIKKYDKKRKSLHQERKKVIKEFQDKVTSDQIAEVDINQFVTSWEEILIKHTKIGKQEFNELSSVLDKGQQARYLLFRVHFPQKMRQLFKLFKQVRHGRALRDEG